MGEIGTRAVSSERPWVGSNYEFYKPSDPDNNLSAKEWEAQIRQNLQKIRTSTKVYKSEAEFRDSFKGTDSSGTKFTEINGKKIWQVESNRRPLKNRFGVLLGLKDPVGRNLFEIEFLAIADKLGNKRGHVLTRNTVAMEGVKEGTKSKELTDYIKQKIEAQEYANRNGVIAVQGDTVLTVPISPTGEVETREIRDTKFGPMTETQFTREYYWLPGWYDPTEQLSDWQLGDTTPYQGRIFSREQVEELIKTRYPTEWEKYFVNIDMNPRSLNTARDKRLSILVNDLLYQNIPNPRDRDVREYTKRYFNNDIDPIYLDANDFNPIHSDLRVSPARTSMMLTELMNRMLNAQMGGKKVYDFTNINGWALQVNRLGLFGSIP